ncbi:hypothetical protein [Actinocatenispora comari]|uniref:Uncharacterized protein n=1 Tax=Actinocatenispora comari TaxID=2807577 RepID=A0A8J4AA05_9ACTN|nr:hypothetical protein [Actinocatenispora comari]GIL27584.1 hypothetical protein NUM_28380 [Actinocatenispora comari]
MNPHDDETERRRGLAPHPTDVLSLVFGLIFLGAGGWWLVAEVSSTELPFGWLLALSLIVIGAIGLFAAVRAGRNKT